MRKTTPFSQARVMDGDVALVNQGQSQGYRDIFAVGLSGGGWTVQVAAAQNAHIRGSYPCAAGSALRS